MSFGIQALIAVTNGIWITAADTLSFGYIHWIQYVNPNYWVTSPMIHAILQRTGDCSSYYSDGTCAIHLGDVVAMNMRMDHINPNASVLALFIIWLSVRLMQYVLLVRDSVDSA